MPTEMRHMSTPTKSQPSVVPSAGGGDHGGGGGINADGNEHESAACMNKNCVAVKTRVKTERSRHDDATSNLSRSERIGISYQGALCRPLVATHVAEKCETLQREKAPPRSRTWPVPFTNLSGR